MFRHNIIKYSLLVCGCLMLSLGLSIFSQVSYQDSVEFMNENSHQNGVISIRDNYNGKGNNLNIREFLNQENSLEKLIGLYTELSSNDSYVYYEIMDQVFEYVGENDIPSSMLVDKDLANQKIEGEYYTPLKALQVSEKVYNIFNVRDNLLNGIGFQSDDYIIGDTNTIPVLLGHNYLEIFDIGDEFVISYLGSVDFSCKVIGFLKSGTNIGFNNVTYLLDDYILVPALNLSEKSVADREFCGILYSLKTTSMIPYNGIDDYNKIVLSLEKSFQDNNLDYKIQSDYIKLESKINLSTKQALIIRAAGIIAGLICGFIYARLNKQTAYKAVEATQISEKGKIRYTFHSLLELTGITIVSCIISFLILRVLKIGYSFPTTRAWVIAYAILLFLISQFQFWHYSRKERNI